MLFGVACKKWNISFLFSFTVFFNYVENGAA